MTDELNEEATEITQPAANVHVRQIVIEGLFGEYTHRIPLAEKGGVVILHGRNGVGKTITLSMIKALLSGMQDQVEVLKKWPFDSIRIEFTDDTAVGARQRPVAETDNEPGKVPRNKRRTAPEVEIIAISNPSTGIGATTFGPPNMWPTDYFRFVDRVKVHYVNTRRLDAELVEDESGAHTSVSAMDYIQFGVIKRINLVNAEYRQTSSLLDDSFAARLFTSPANAAIDPRDLERRNEALEKERRRLRDIGLLPASKTSFHPDQLDPTKQAMFAVYLDDNEKKLAVFKDLADRAEILLDVLNAKLAPKRVRLDNRRGYRVFSHDGQPLQLDWLSSGEQHEFILLHQLLFDVMPGSLLLIDEPELSLHVTWQSEFLDDLIRIAKRIGFDAIVATHSPYIVGSRRDLMVQLGAPE
jgi:ABC-type lipoprotein export system ATPase subunit